MHLPFNFQLIDASWEAQALATLIADYEAALPTSSWPNSVLGDHDRSRRREARAGPGHVAMLLLTLRGTPTLYLQRRAGLEQTSRSRLPN